MYTVTIGGCEIGLRCDLNAYEEIVEKYGSIEEAVKISEDTKDNIKRLKFLTAIFANEHNAFIGDSRRFTETEIGRMMRCVRLQKSPSEISAALCYLLYPR